MKLDGAIILIERRSIGHCIDLAMTFVRIHFAKILLLTSIFALPSCILSWILAYFEFGGALLPVLQICIFLGVSPYLGAAIVAGCGRRVFGDKLSIKRSIRLVMSRFVLFTMIIFLTRLLLFSMSCLVIPVPLVATYFGFYSEVMFLEEEPFGKIHQRASDLANSAFGDLLGRQVYLWFIFGALTISGFLMLEFILTVFFSYPLIFGKVSSNYWFEESMDLLTTNPDLMVAVQVVMWLLYPICRLAWFFSYLDTRTQTECWDIRTKFRLEAQRLRGLV